MPSGGGRLSYLHELQRLVRADVHLQVARIELTYLDQCIPVRDVDTPVADFDKPIPT